MRKKVNTKTTVEQNLNQQEVCVMFKKSKLLRANLDELRNIAQDIVQVLGIECNCKTRAELIDFILENQKEYFERLNTVNAIETQQSDDDKNPNPVENTETTTNTETNELEELEKLVNTPSASYIGIKPNPNGILKINDKIGDIIELDVEFRPLYEMTENGVEFGKRFNVWTSWKRHKPFELSDEPKLQTFPVSQDYTIYKTEDIIEQLKESTETEIQVRHAQILSNGGEVFVYLSTEKIELETVPYEIFTGEEKVGIKGKDIVEIGFVIENSYNTMRSLKIRYGLYRQICQNGSMAMSKSFVFNAIHRKGIDYKEYEKFLERKNNFIQVIMNSTKKHLSNHQYEWLKKELSKIGKKYVEKFENDYGVIETNRKPTAWDIHNILTRIATHDIQNSSDQYAKLENLAWTIL